MKFMMILRDPSIATLAHVEGEVIPFLDLETLGKQDRQGHLDTWKSSHTPADVTAVREAVPDAHLLVRINPLHDGSQAELDDVIARGADSVMLPMFRTRRELGRFTDMLRGRADAWPLFETSDSVRDIESIVAGLGVSRVHFGMNDLHLDLGLNFIFEPLANGLLEEPCASLRDLGIGFGIGGVARAGEGELPPEALLGEHVRLGSDAAILSRTFHRGAPDAEAIRNEMDFAAEVGKLRNIVAKFEQGSEQERRANHLATKHRIEEIAARIASTRKERTSG